RKSTVRRSVLCVVAVSKVRVDVDRNTTSRAAIMSFQPQMKRAAQLQQANPDKKLGSVYLDALADLDTPVTALLKLRKS
ncbi:hypothetical protein L917_08790, partial [Phytophthora nicotianae]